MQIERALRFFNDHNMQFYARAQSKLAKYGIFYFLTLFFRYL